jgi:hypothetical protein
MADIIIEPTTLSATYSIPDVTIPIYLNPSIMTLYVSPYYTVKSGGIPNWNTLSNMPNEWIRKCGGKDYSNEKQLYRKAVTEAYNRFGICMTYYIVSYDTAYDKIWGEDNDRRFVRKFDIMAYYPLNTEEKMWTKFAIQGIDNFSIFVSKDHFREACTYGNTVVPGNIGPDTYSTYVPKVGDVIQSKYNDYLYEVVTVKEESMMFHLDKHYVWELIVNPYKDMHLRLDAVTSASMNNLSADMNIADIFNIEQIVASAVSAVEYTPRSREMPPRDPFGGW